MGIPTYGGGGDKLMITRLFLAAEARLELCGEISVSQKYMHVRYITIEDIAMCFVSPILHLHWWLLMLLLMLIMMIMMMI